MPEPRQLVLFHIPQSRSITILWLLEELGQPYRIRQLDIARNEQRGAEYRQVNPAGKVPAVIDGDQVLTERGAIAVHLADRYAMGRLAPPIDDPRRGDYLRWMFYAIGVMEPLLAFAMLKIEPDAPPGALAWGEWETMIETLTAAVSKSPWLLGDQFTAADVMIASFLGWGMAVEVIPRTGPLGDYVGRATQRPSWKRTLAADGKR
ncbi:glutathione S-transferase [Allostella sp. ATCC 35155]|nr:glutathione S-transferase [Stella sp. ATCC 35155]